MRAIAFVVAVVVAGCGAGRSQVGPYVKSVIRDGEWLAVTKCMIVLDDEVLHEQECSLHKIPLRSVPPPPPPAPVAVAPPP